MAEEPLPGILLVVHLGALEARTRFTTTAVQGGTGGLAVVTAEGEEEDRVAVVLRVTQEVILAVLLVAQAVQP